MWQKERLLNIALGAVPSVIENVACLDCDIILNRARRLARSEPRSATNASCSAFFASILSSSQSFVGRRTDAAHISFGLSFARLREQGHTARELCNPDWSDPNDPPVTYGLAWAFRRELFAHRGFYDPWIVGGGARVHFFAGDGYWQEASVAFQFHPTMREHFIVGRRASTLKSGASGVTCPGQLLIVAWRHGPTQAPSALSRIRSI